MNMDEEQSEEQNAAEKGVVASEKPLQKYYDFLQGKSEQDLTPGDIPLEYFKSLNLIDDILFSKVASHPEAMEEMLRTILEMDDLKVNRVETQKNLRNVDQRSVILDAYCELADGKLVNVEVQKSNNDHMQKRMRYNLSNMDTALVEKGTEFEDLPDVYLILISTFDAFGYGQTSYHVRRMVEGIAGEVHEVYNGVKEIYVNTAVKSDTKIGKLMDFFLDWKKEAERFPVLSQKVQNHILTEAGLEHMKSLEDIMFENGMRRGKENERMEIAKNLLKMGLLSLAQIAEASKLPLETVEQLAKEVLVAV